MTAPLLFCFGYGFSARALAAQLEGAGWRIAGTSRSGGTAPDGRKILAFDGGAPNPEISEALSEAAAVLASIPPGEAGDPALLHHGADIAASQTIGWIGYLSTTAVYGDHGGDWVDEASELRPRSARGDRRVAAERAWQSLRNGAAPVHVFRPSGIYGPGRSAFDAIAAGRARRLDKPGQLFNRIHVDDIAGALAASLAKPEPGAVYNLADDLPAASAEVIAHACALIGQEPPPLIPFEQAELSEMARSFYGESKKVSNQALKQRLGYDLKYPTYREGLAALAP
ncbi:MAG: SDR family oxidoreductase [Pseudomonadota bacterium]